MSARPALLRARVPRSSSTATPIPAALRASIACVRHCTTGLEGADRVELTLANENLRWLDHPLLALDTQLAAVARLRAGPARRRCSSARSSRSRRRSRRPAADADGRRAGSPAALQQGNEVALVRASRSRPSATSRCPTSPSASIVSARERPGADLRSGRRALSVLLGGVESSAPLGDPDVAQKIIRKQSGESDYDFLDAHRRGERLGDGHRSQRAARRARAALHVAARSPIARRRRSTYGRSLLDFTPRLTNVGQIARVTATVWVPPIKMTFTVTSAGTGTGWRSRSTSRPALMPARGGADEPT